MSLHYSATGMCHKDEQPAACSSEERAVEVRDIEDLHRDACSRQESFYKDPATGLVVFTAYHLSKRPCCGCGCRHCPYKPNSSENVSSRFLSGSIDDLNEDVDVLFWSGGKDSFLALRALQREGVREVVLLTTYNHDTKTVAHQEVNIDDIQKQAKVLQLPLLAVPVAYGEYLSCVRKALDKLRDNGIEISRLAFGDLHLRHIRNWRDSQLGDLGAPLHYPLWKAPYDKLLHELEVANVTIRITAVDKSAHGTEEINVGDLFNRQFVGMLPPCVDSFGENGEFHTLVQVWEPWIKPQHMWGN